MFNLFKKRLNVVKFTPCVDSNEISNFVIRDLLSKIEDNNTITIGFMGNACLKDILHKFANRLNSHNINYANINFVNLAEFNVIKTKDYDGPFNDFMKREFYDKLKVNKERIHKIDNDESKIIDFLNRNTLDVLIIEVGIDGDICFHSEKSLLNFSWINKIKISESTREEYAILFNNDKTKLPLYGSSINFKTILTAKNIILIGCGKEKATPVDKILENKIDKLCIATYLLKNKNVSLYADLPALQLVNK